MLNMVFNIQFVSHKLLIFTAFTQKYILTQMNEMITYALRFVMGRKKWLEQRQVDIKSTREKAPLCFLRMNIANKLKVAGQSDQS